MSPGTFISWKEECEAVHGEMDRLLTSGWPETAEEREVRKIQFVALIERRNVSAHKFLSPPTAIPAVGKRERAITPARPHADRTPGVKVTSIQVSQEPPDAVPAVAPYSQSPSADPRLGAKIFLRSLGL
jgi:hypothetical protein